MSLTRFAWLSIAAAIATIRFVSLHVLVPSSWTVQTGHDLLDQLEGDIDAALGGAAVFTHLEPVEDRHHLPAGASR